MWGVGIGASVQHLEVNSNYVPLLAASTERLGATISIMSGLCFHAGAQVFACLNVDPKLLVRAESGQPQTSYIFPLGIGLRYDYRLKDEMGAR